MLESSGKTIYFRAAKAGRLFSEKNVDVPTDDETLGSAILPHPSLKQKRRLEELLTWQLVLAV
jgi:hypothetical protein